MITIGLAAVAQSPYPRKEIGVSCGDRSAIPERAQVLRRVEAVGRHSAEASHRPSRHGSRVRLAAVLEDRQPVTLRDRCDCRHVRRPARRDVPA